MKLTHEDGELATIHGHVYLTTKGSAKLTDAGIKPWPWLVEYRKGLNNAETENQSEGCDDGEKVARDPRPEGQHADQESERKPGDPSTED